MKTLFLKRDFKTETAKLEGKHAALSHVDRVIKGDVVVIAPDGSITAVFITQQIDSGLYNPAYELWKTVAELPSNRATAVGSSSLPRPRNDGTLSERRAVPKTVLELLERRGVRHGVLGFLDATPDQPCHQTPLSKSRPEMLARNELLIKRVDYLYARHLPSFSAIQKAEVDSVPQWRLWNTVFTTVYVIMNLRCAYHRDSGNLGDVMSAIIALGEFLGGELVFPRWRIAFALKPGDLLLFDPQQLHGNLAFEGERLSAIFYCERQIAECDK